MRGPRRPSAVRRARFGVTLVALGVALATPDVAAADSWRSWRWAVSLDFSARWATNLPDPDRTEDLHQGAGSVEVRALAGKSAVQLAASADFELGFEVPGAFVYGAHLSPLGFAIRPFGRSYLGATIGFGGGGATGRVPIAWELPLVTFVELDLGRHVRVVARGRATFVAGDDARADGSTTIGFADEAEASFGLAFGKRHDQYGARWSDGTLVGVFVREQLGERIVGVVIAIAGNGSSR